MLAQPAESGPAATGCLNIGNDSVVVNVLPAQDRDSRRATQRIDHRVVGEGHTAISQCGEARHQAKKSPVQVIGQNENNVVDL